nr:hypothetical protein [Cronobacter sakazakii]
MSVIISHAEPTPRSGLDLIKALTTGTLMPGGLWQKKKLSSEIRAAKLSLSARHAALYGCHGEKSTL